VNLSTGLEAAPSAVQPTDTASKDVNEIKSSKSLENTKEDSCTIPESSETSQPEPPTKDSSTEPEKVPAPCPMNDAKEDSITISKNDISSLLKCYIDHQQDVLRLEREKFEFEKRKIEIGMRNKMKCEVLVELVKQGKDVEEIQKKWGWLLKQ
jgi:hypothetical protein